MTETNPVTKAEATKPTTEEFQLLHQARTETYLGSMRRYLTERMNTLVDLAIGVPLSVVGAYNLAETVFQMELNGVVSDANLPKFGLYGLATAAGIVFLSYAHSHGCEASQLEKGLKNQEEELRQLRCGLLDRVRELRKERGAE